MSRSICPQASRPRLRSDLVRKRRGFDKEHLGLICKGQNSIWMHPVVVQNHKCFVQNMSSLQRFQWSPPGLVQKRLFFFSYPCFVCKYPGFVLMRLGLVKKCPIFVPKFWASFGSLKVPSESIRASFRTIKITSADAHAPALSKDIRGSSGAFQALYSSVKVYRLQI